MAQTWNWPSFHPCILSQKLPLSVQGQKLEQCRLDGEKLLYWRKHAVLWSVLEFSLLISKRFLDTFLFFQRNLRIQNTWMLNGTHYSKVRLSRILRIYPFSDTRSLAAVDEGQGVGNFENFCKRIWQKWGSKTAQQLEIILHHVQVTTFVRFLWSIVSSEAFAYNKGNDWCVAHYTFKRN